MSDRSDTPAPGDDPDAQAAPQVLVVEKLRSGARMRPRTSAETAETPAVAFPLLGSGVRRRVARRRPRPTQGWVTPPTPQEMNVVSLTNVSTHQLQIELDRRRKGLEKLLARRDDLSRQLAEVRTEIESLGGEAGEAAETAPRRAARGGGGPGRSRAKNSVSLPQALAQAIEVRATVTPSEAAQILLQNGFQSTSSRFPMMVANALAKDPRFKRVERGVYERVE